MNASILLVFMAFFGDDPLELAAPPAPEGPCQLVVDGEGVEKLIVEQSNSNRYSVDITSPGVSLASGLYNVKQVILKGGYSYNYIGAMPSFTLTADAPYHFQAGGLSPHVDVKRQGRLLKMDYRLTDAAGRRCIHADYSSPSRFSVLQGGQEIASGSFEYG
jgi:hypothetical protein